MASTTFREAQHPRAGDGKFKDKGWSSYRPRHQGGLSREARVRTAAGGMAASGLWALGQGAFLIGALLSVAGASVLAWGGYKGAKRRRKRRNTRPKSARTPRFGAVRFTSEAQVEAYIKLQEWRREKRRQRVASVGRGAKATGRVVASGARTVRARVKPS